MSRVESPVWRQIELGQAPTETRVAEVVAAEAVLLGSDGAAAARRHLRAQVLGAGPLEGLLADPNVTDILVNGADGVWVDRGDGLRRQACDVGDAAAVRRLAVRLAGLAGRRLDEASPYVDGLLAGGVRLHAILPPLVDAGAHLSLRMPRRVAPSLEQLMQWDSFDRHVADLLKAVVAHRRAFIVSGGTGSGKTTLLAAMLAEVAPRERLVIVEDVREMKVDHPHVVRLQGRAPNVEGRGAVTLVDLVRQSLRMRPDRLVLGEARGAEVRELLSALNTGHEGGCGTVHANASGDVVARFEALGALAGLSREAVHAQLGSALDVVIHTARVADRRVVQEIGVLSHEGLGVPTVRRAVVRTSQGYAPAEGWPQLAALLGPGAARAPRRPPAATPEDQPPTHDPDFADQGRDAQPSRPPALTPPAFARQ